MIEQRSLGVLREHGVQYGLLRINQDSRLQFRTLQAGSWWQLGRFDDSLSGFHKPVQGPIFTVLLRTITPLLMPTRKKRSFARVPGAT